MARGEHRIYVTTKQHVALAKLVSVLSNEPQPYDVIARDLIANRICPLFMAPEIKPGTKPRFRCATAEEVSNLKKCIIESSRSIYGADVVARRLAIAMAA